MYKVGRSRTPQGVRGLKPKNAHHISYAPSGRTPQGVRGLKRGSAIVETAVTRRTPQGVRGLKLLGGNAPLVQIPSHSARSAWIETLPVRGSRGEVPGRTPQGVRGLKHHYFLEIAREKGRTPQGVRGLKPEKQAGKTCWPPSHSARSAWIETRGLLQCGFTAPVALRKECVD